MAEHEPSASNAITTNPQSLADSAPVSTADQLACLLELLQQPIPEETAAAYKERLAAVGLRISEIAQQVQGVDRERLEVVAANAASAACDPNDVAKNSTAIELNSSTFNLLAYHLPTNQAFKRGQLASEWAQYQKNNSLAAATMAISRLVTRGVLELAGPDTVQRSDRPLILRGQSLVPTPLHGAPPAIELASRRHELVSVSEIVRTLLQQPSLADFKRRVDHAFGAHSDDKMRLLVVTAAGLSAVNSGKLWSPPIAGETVLYHILNMTGLSISNVRVAVWQGLVADFMPRLTAKISELAYEEALQRSPECSATLSRDAGLLVANLALSNPNSRADINAATSALGINSDNLPTFVATVLHRAKEPLGHLLEQSHLPGMLGSVGVKMVRLISDYVINDRTFREVGESAGLTRERIRQYWERIAAIHPLVEAILNAPVPKPIRAQLTIPDALLAVLTEEVRRNPKDAHQFGLAADPSQQELPEEHPTDYFRRIFSVAFAGRYANNAKTTGYPHPLRHLADGPNRYFHRLAYECIDILMRDAIEKFSRTLTDDMLDRMLESCGVTAQVSDLPSTRTYVRALVNQPTGSRAELFRRSGSSLAQSDAERIFSLIEPIVRELGKVRAQHACRVLDEPWCRPWLPSEKLLNILSKRILGQLSIAETCAALKITGGIYSMKWHQLTLRFPTLVDLVPRRACGSRMRKQ